MSNERNVTTFFEECLDPIDSTCSVCASHLGMAYRAWTGDIGASDLDACRLVRAAVPGAELRTIVLGGSTWMEGAQLSGTGEDMVSEGVVAGLGAEVGA